VTPAPEGPATYLNRARRERELEELADGATVDLLVIGGGVTGAGAALDAAARGLSVALLERRDLANGTSRWSSKLVHGGLRYLAAGQFGVAWESARERATLARVTAPHLIRALPQLTPVLGREAAPAAALMEVGIRIGDAMRALSGTSRRRLPSMRRIGAAEARLWTPALRRRGVRGAILAWDGQLEDDARLVVALARTAAAHGARILTYCEVTGIDGAGAKVADTLGGRTFEVSARHVINATGVWADRLVDGIELCPSRGSHLLVRAERLGHPRAMMNVPDPDRFGRFVFAIPRLDGLVMLGLTDEPVQGTEIPDAPDVPASDEQHLLSAVSRALELPLGPGDVVGRFAGLRPLLGRAGERATADISRRHAVLEDPSTGAVTVVGGKLTTYRQMAEDAVDLIAGRMRRPVGPCRTGTLQLVGAPLPGAPTDARCQRRLTRRFGIEAAAVAGLAGERRALLEPVGGAGGVLPVEWLAAIEREGALCAEDVLDRRTRAGLVPEWRAEAAERLDALLPELGAVPA